MGKSEIRLPNSKLVKAVADELVRVGYLEKVNVEAGKPRDTLHIIIGAPVQIHEIKRMSTPGRRLYVGANEIPRVQSGRGMAILSTNQGILTGQAAKAKKLGGELLLTVY
ncbi:30S ribosomal protein S8 [Candidatus Saccharibacteria bacterium]|nr:30S ribosomal protein S8 [Candidatus Saccharibacteria bacterium]